MNKLLVPICNRTNYTKIKPVLSLLKNKLDINMILSSSMVISHIGDSYLDIINDGLTDIRKIDCLMFNDSLESMSKTIGLSLIEHSSLYAEEKPNAILITGDRFDMLSQAIAAKIMNIPIFHIQGGELSGSIDNTIRDIITLCSDRHYPATDVAAKRIKSITKSKFIFNFGCPAVEFMYKINVGEYLDVNKFIKHFKDSINIKPNEKYFLIMVHPNTLDDKDIDMDNILKASLSFGHKCIVIYPNIDAFNKKITSQINKNRDKLICIKHAPLEDFAKLMAHAACLIGNSSSGIREAASFGTPVVNIGNRQINRERNDNIIDCKTNFESVYRAINLSISKGIYPKNNIYYKENCALNISNDILGAINEC